eukprot:3016939-Prymnesium_polylepis.1
MAIGGATPPRRAHHRQSRGGPGRLRRADSSPRSTAAPPQGESVAPVVRAAVCSGPSRLGSAAQPLAPVTSRRVGGVIGGGEVEEMLERNGPRSAQLVAQQCKLHVHNAPACTRVSNTRPTRVHTHAHAGAVELPHLELLLLDAVRERLSRRL